jgi:hypothetical protein
MRSKHAVAPAAFNKEKVGPPTSPQFAELVMRQ